MAFTRSFLMAGILLLLSGCYNIFSNKELVSQDEGLAALPNTTEGYVGKDLMPIRIVRQRKSNDYAVTMPDEQDQVGFRLRLFDIGSKQLYGAQVDFPKVPGEFHYAIIGTRLTESVQVDIYELTLTEAQLTDAGVSYRGNSKDGIKVSSRADLTKLMQMAVRTNSYRNSATIQTEPDGFANSHPTAKSTFNSSGYTAGTMLIAIYDGKTNGASVYVASPYLMTFLDYLGKSDRACQGNMISGTAAIKLATMSTARGFEIIAGARIEVENNASGSRDRAFMEGMAGGAKAFAALMAITAVAQLDAKTFHSRHGCSSRDAKQLFGNMNKWIVSK